MAEATGPPTLPIEVYYGPIGRYVEIMRPTTEAPPEFHFGAFLTSLSILFGTCYLEVGGRRLYPTLFSILTGSTGITHKTTVANQVVTFLRLVAPDLIILPGSGSREGLVKSLPDEGSPVFWRAPEFTQQLRKAANSGTGNLVEFWLEIYDRPSSIEHRLAKETIIKHNPCVAMLSDGTESYLTEVFSVAAIGNGLLNRLCIWMGQPGGPIPFPPAPDTVELDRLVEEVRLAAKKAEGLPVTASEEALEAWSDLYHAEVYPMQQRPGGEAYARLSDMTWKVATIFTLADQRSVVEKDDLLSGWTVAKYLVECSSRIAGQIGASEQAQLCEAVATAVEKHGPIPSAGYLPRHISPRWRSKLDDFGGAKRVLDRLVRDERIDFAEGRGFFGIGT